MQGAPAVIGVGSAVATETFSPTNSPTLDSNIVHLKVVKANFEFVLLDGRYIQRGTCKNWIMPEDSHLPTERKVNEV